MDNAKKTLDSKVNLAQCDETDRLYNHDIFPKTCNTCKIIYHNRVQFIKETTALTNGVYSKGAKGKVFEYRNCNCGSTLVCAIENLRDDSPEGNAKRLEFDRKLNFLQSNGITPERAKEILRSKIKKSFEG